MGHAVAKMGREKRLLKDVIMCFGGHQCAELDENCWQFCGKHFGERGVNRSPIDVDDTRGGVMDRRCGVEKRGSCFVCKVALSHLKVGINHARTSCQQMALR